MLILLWWKIITIQQRNGSAYVTSRILGSLYILTHVASHTFYNVGVNYIMLSIMYNVRNWKTERLSKLPKVTQLHVPLPGFEPNSRHEWRKTNADLTLSHSHQTLTLSGCLCVNISVYMWTELLYIPLMWLKCIWILKSEYVRSWLSTHPEYQKHLQWALAACLSCPRGSLLSEECLEMTQWMRNTTGKPGSALGPVCKKRPETQLSSCTSIILPDLSCSQLAAKSHWAPTVCCSLYQTPELLEGEAWGLPWRCSGWDSACRCRPHGLDSWSGKIARAAEQRSPGVTTTEACEPKARASRQEKPLRWGACKQRSPQTEEPASHSQRKPTQKPAKTQHSQKE